MAASGLTVKGRVIENLGNMRFRIMLDNGHQPLCHIGGKMRKNNIKVIVGDIVTVELGEYDLTKGRIIYREK